MKIFCIQNYKKTKPVKEVFTLQRNEMGKRRKVGERRKRRRRTENLTFLWANNIYSEAILSEILFDARLVIINGFLSGQFIAAVKWESKLTAMRWRIVQDHVATIDRVHRYEGRSTFWLVPRPYSLLSRVGKRRLVFWLMNLRGLSTRRIAWVSFKLPWKGSTRKLKKMNAEVLGL